MWSRAEAGASHQLYAKTHTDGTAMAKEIVRRRKRTSGRGPTRALAHRAGWVRKNVIMNQRKLDAAKRALGVDTETEAIDLALDFVASATKWRKESP